MDMYTMLVVDDNPADRRGVCSLFDWNELGIQIVGACPNGQRALEAINDKKVDIVLTDIAMPVMNGIELAESLKASHPDIKIVFMSCYSDFDYARSAMDLDIYGYVLKPIIPDELLKVVRKLLDEYRDEAKRHTEKETMVRQLNEMLPMVQEQFLKEWLLGNCFDPEEIQKRMEFLQLGIGSYGSIHVISLVIDDYEKQTNHLSVEDKYYVSYTMRNVIASLGTSEMIVLPVQFSGRDYSFIVFIKPDTGGNGCPDIMDLAVGVHTAVLSGLKLSTTIGISKMSRDITQAHELYRQSIDAVNTQFYGGSNPLIRYELIESGRYTTLDQTVNLEELYHVIKELVTTGDESADEEFINRYLSQDRGILPESYVKSLTYSIVNMIAVAMMESGYSFADVFGSDMVIWEKLGKFKTIVNIRQWLLNLFKALREYFNERNQSRTSKLVDAVRQIIRDRYHEQISVEDISKALFLSQSYANSIIKKETGKSIFDHLLEYRLEMAKKLLMDPESKVSVISENVGYENKSYFSLMFKKYVGLSPTEYKARFTS
jgi:two-component system, response regulator YesN